jgi:hypothetical protein
VAGRLVEVPAAAFEESAGHLMGLARAHDGASVSRMARRLGLAGSGASGSRARVATTTPEASR